MPNCVGTTQYTSAMSESQEYERSRMCSDGTYTEVKEGTGVDTYVPKWSGQGEHNPTNELNMRIRSFIRATPGVTKNVIRTHFQEQKYSKKTVDGNLREMNKMGFFRII